MSIFEAINAVMAEVGAVGKNHKNDQQKYQYRGIDDVMSALSPAMQKCGVFVAPTVTDIVREVKEGRNSQLLYSIVTVNYRFYSTDGSFIETTVMGEGMDSGDKATNKAMSAAFKYALLQTFCIPAEEMLDSEQDSPEVVGRGSRPAPAPAKPEAATSQEQRQEFDRDRELVDLVARSTAAGVNVLTLCDLYGVDSVEKLTNNNLYSIKNHWAEVVARLSQGEEATA